MPHEHPIATDEAPSDAVITAISLTVEQSPLDLDPLIDTIDPDALNSILRRADETNSAVTIAFDYAGHEITATPAKIRIARSE